MGNVRDLDTLRDMLARAGIEYKYSTVSEVLREHEEYTPGHALTIEGGYVGFVSYILFDNDGTLKSIEAYE